MNTVIQVPSGWKAQDCSASGWKVEVLKCRPPKCSEEWQNSTRFLPPTPGWLVRLPFSLHSYSLRPCKSDFIWKYGRSRYKQDEVVLDVAGGGGGPWSNDWCSNKKRESGHRHRLKEGNHVMAEADFGVVTTTTQRMLRTAGSQEVPQESGRILPASLWRKKHGPAGTLIPSLQNWESTFLLLQNTQFVIMCYSSPRKQIFFKLLLERKACCGGLYNDLQLCPKLQQYGGCKIKAQETFCQRSMKTLAFGKNGNEE